MTKLDITIIGQDNIIYGQDNIIYGMKLLLEQAMEINDTEYEFSVLLKYEDGTEHYVPVIIGIDREEFDDLIACTPRYFDNPNYPKFISLRYFDNIETRMLSVAYMDFTAFVKSITSYIQLYTHDFSEIFNTRIFDTVCLGNSPLTFGDIAYAKHNDYALKSLVEYLNVIWEKCDRKRKYVGVETIWLIDQIHENDNTDCFKYLSDELRDALIDFYVDTNPEIVVYLIETAPHTDPLERFKL